MMYRFIEATGIFLIAASLAVIVFGQETQIRQQLEQREKSNLEKFSSRSGALLEKQFINLGKISGVEVKVLRITDLLTKLTSAGIRFEQEVGRSYGRRTSIAFLDQDEADGLIKSIKYIQQNILNSSRSDYTEIEFTSRGDFQIGCYFSSNKWQPYLRTSRYDRDALVTLSAEDLAALQSFLESAKAKHFTPRYIEPNDLCRKGEFTMITLHPPIERPSANGYLPLLRRPAGRWTAQPPRASRNVCDGNDWNTNPRR